VTHACVIAGDAPPLVESWTYSSRFSCSALWRTGNPKSACPSPSMAAPRRLRRRPSWASMPSRSAMPPLRVAMPVRALHARSGSGFYLTLAAVPFPAARRKATTAGRWAKCGQGGCRGWAAALSPSSPCAGPVHTVRAAHRPPACPHAEPGACRREARSDARRPLRGHQTRALGAPSARQPVAGAIRPWIARGRVQIAGFGVGRAGAATAPGTGRGLRLFERSERTTLRSNV